MFANFRNCRPGACDARYSGGSGSEPNSGKDQGTRKGNIWLSRDLCSAVADKLRFELHRPELETEYVAVNASNRIPLLQNGTIDIECGSTTNSAERQKQVSFSIATYVASPRWLVSASSPVVEMNGLDGQTIVVTQGSLNYAIARK